MVRSFTNICPQNSILVKMGQNNGQFTRTPKCIYAWRSVSHFTDEGMGLPWERSCSHSSHSLTAQINDLNESRILSYLVKLRPLGGEFSYLKQFGPVLCDYTYVWWLWFVRNWSIQCKTKFYTFFVTGMAVIFIWGRMGLLRSDGGSEDPKKTVLK
jgi:hypothetical protein